jgi:hypothetical protein
MVTFYEIPYSTIICEILEIEFLKSKTKTSKTQK